MSAKKNAKLLEENSDEPAAGYNTMEGAKVVAVNKMQSMQRADPGLKDWDNYLRKT